MATPAPRQIAHYQVTGTLGEGGMGVVYRALDTKLGREVALKVLTPAFAEDGERLARFAREARVLASLNHPGIAAVYGVEKNALVMELVEGPTLEDRIAKSAMGVDEALPLFGCWWIDACSVIRAQGSEISAMRGCCWSLLFLRPCPWFGLRDCPGCYLQHR